MHKAYGIIVCLSLGIFCGPAKAEAEEGKGREQDALAKIAAKKPEACKKELDTLLALYQQARCLRGDERERFFRLFVESLRAKGIQAPPPPLYPCSRIQSALESCARQESLCANGESPFTCESSGSSSASASAPSP